MKKAVCFIALILTYYIGGMYQSLPLMTLFVSELFLLIFLFFLPRYFRRICTPEFERHGDVVEKNTEYPCEIKMSSRGRLPVSRFQIKLSVRGRFGKKQDVQMNDGVDRKCVCRLTCDQSFSYCGMFYLRLEKAVFYDYLSVFSVKKRVTEEMKLAVLPKNTALQIVFSRDCQENGRMESQYVRQRMGNTGGDIREIREYREGDLLRAIHWKQNARMQRLWIKEFEDEARNTCVLVLDTEEFDATQKRKCSAFFEVLSAILLGLLKKQMTVRVRWQEKECADFVWMDVYQKEQCRELLLRLYEADFLDEAGNHGGEPADVMCLNFHLEWFWNNVMLYRFSVKTYESEIAQKMIQIP